MRSTLISNVDGLQLSYLGSEPASSLYPCPVRGKEQQFKVEQLIKSRSRHASQQKADRHIDDKGCLSLGFSRQSFHETRKLVSP